MSRKQIFYRIKKEVHSKSQRRSNERQHLESNRTKRPLIFSKDQNSVTKVKSCSVLKMGTGIRKPDRQKRFSNDKPTCKDPIPITGWTCQEDRSSIESRKQSIDDAACLNFIPTDDAAGQTFLLTDDDLFQELDKLEDPF